jgi:hypothetical protein
MSKKPSELAYEWADKEVQKLEGPIDEEQGEWLVNFASAAFLAGYYTEHTQNHG